MAVPTHLVAVPTHLVALPERPVELSPLSQSKRQALHPGEDTGVRFRASPGLAVVTPKVSHFNRTPSLCSPLSSADHRHHRDDHTHSQAQVHIQGHYCHPGDHPHSLKDMDMGGFPRRNTGSRTNMSKDDPGERKRGRERKGRTSLRVYTPATIMSDPVWVGRSGLGVKFSGRELC